MLLYTVAMVVFVLAGLLLLKRKPLTVQEEKDPHQEFFELVRKHAQDDEDTRRLKAARSNMELFKLMQQLALLRTEQLQHLKHRLTSLRQSEKRKRESYLRYRLLPRYKQMELN